LLQKAQAAFGAGDFNAAQRLARKLLAQDDANPAARALAIRSAVPLGLVERAGHDFDQLSAADRGRVCRSLVQTGNQHLEQRRLAHAERYFRSVLSFDARHLPANDRLAYLLRLTGRYQQAVPYELELLRQNHITVDVLVAVAQADAIHPNAATVQWLEQCRADNPEDPLPHVGLARAALLSNDPHRARELAERAVGLDSDSVWAHVLLGRALVATGRREDLERWNRGLPPQAEEDAGTWHVRSLWARLDENWTGAARCFAEVVRRDPHHSAANYGLLQVLTQAGEHELASLAAERTGALDELARLTKAFGADPEDPRVSRRIARWMEAEDRALEADAWRRLAAMVDPQKETAFETRLLEGDSPSKRSENFQRLLAGAARFPLPEWSDRGQTLGPSETADVESDAEIAFVNSAAAAGLDFHYVNSGAPAEHILHMQESNGGGVAVLDYDRDSRPDLYFPQGGSWPPEEVHHAHRDRLYRNTVAATMVDATDGAGLDERRFGQGVAAGDYNNDGFPDLFVGNIGANRLYRNNGDGTFSDASDELDADDCAWTTSCLIADLNGDALPDLYAVNYLSGSDVFTRICRGRHGEPAACTPDLFAGAPDEVFLNLGDGRFAAQAQSAGVALPEGKGLGIVAADFDGSGLLNLFVANDQVPNFYFVNESQPQQLAFQEQGVLSGLAFDRDGRAQACMGIALDDIDRDGRPDLFVTNFYNESNTLYAQQPYGGFIDATVSARLRDPSFALLGFGTQFLDADLDGDPDLFIANGHVTRAKDAPYRMRPQLLRNHRGRFVEVPPGELGEYFEGAYLGRAAATLDWNRDGLMDCALTHLDAPAGLLTNRTRGAGHWLKLGLCGVTSSRDAVGAVVRVRCGEAVWVRHLAAGDGFQASNERRMLFGLAACRRVDEVHVRWPSGVEQSFHNLTTGMEYLLIENNPTPHVMP
jgi:tetratricopeptide (TPR) repeat protein